MADETTDPQVPLLAPNRQAMSLSAALRQAAIDVPTDLPPGLHLSASFTEKAGQVVVTVKAKNAYGVAAWQEQYDGSGRRLTVGAGVTW